MLKNLMMGTAVIALSVAGMTVSANAVVIDSFADATQSISIGGPLDGAPCVDDSPSGNVCTGGDDSAIVGSGDAPVSQTAADNAATAGGGAGASAGSILGGYRDITTTLIQSPNSGSTTDADVFSGVFGYFSHTQDARVYSNTYITWDGLAGAGLNANLSGDDKFHLIVLSADDGVDWSLQLFDELGNNAIHTFSNVGVITTPTHLYLPFALFAGFDFTEVDKIIFGANINSEVDFDTTVGLIETTRVPEPASLTLLGAGIMGLGYFGKRNRKA